MRQNEGCLPGSVLYVEFFKPPIPSIMAVTSSGATGSADDEDDVSEEELAAVQEPVAEVEIGDDVESEADDGDAELLNPAEALRAFTRSMVAFSRRRAWASRDASCAIPSLIGAVVAGEGNDDTALEALQAVCNLIRANDINRGAAHDAGAVGYAIALLDRTGPVVAGGAQALCWLSAGADPEKPGLVRRGGAIPSLLSGPLASAAENPEAAYWAAGALQHIAAADNAGRSAIIAADRGLPRLVALLDFAVPWVAGIDSPRRTTQPTQMHKRAAIRAAEALAEVMTSEEGTEAVSECVTTVAKESPRIGQAISAASKRLLKLLQASARNRLNRAQSGGSASSMKDALTFARAVRLPKAESGAARHFFDAHQRMTADQRKHPWRYDGSAGPGAGHAISLPSPRGGSSPSGVRGGSSPLTPRGSSPLTPRGSSPSPRGRAASPGANHRASSPRQRDATAAAVPSPRSPGMSSCASSPALSMHKGGGSSGNWQMSATTGGAAGHDTGPVSVMPPPPPMVDTPRGLEADTPRGLDEGYAVTESGAPTKTGEFRLRSLGGFTAPPAYTMARSGRGGIQSVSAAAEERMDAQLAAVRAVLSDSMASLQREHEEMTSQLKSDNRKLQHALAVARSREADLEERLKRASQVMSGLIVK